MSYLASDIVSQVQAKLGDTSFSPTDILQYILNTNRDIHNTYQLRYMQASQDFTTVASQSSIGTLPTDLQTVYSLRRTDTNYAGKLEYMSFDDFDAQYPAPEASGTGIPNIWYDFANVINVFPLPNIAYGLTLRYLKKASTFTASETPDVPEEFQEVLTLGALKQAMERRQRFDVAQLYGQQYDEKVLALVQRYAVGQMSETDNYIMTPPVGRNI